jgi:hypothetical protein
VSGGVKVTDQGLTAFMARLKGIAADSVKVEAGVFEGDRVAIGAVHEFGAGDIPQRSFIRATLDEHRAELTALQQRLAREVLTGKLSPEAARALLGSTVVAWCRDRVDSNIAPPLQPETVRRKGHDHALVETGALKDAITWRPG